MRFSQECHNRADGDHTLPSVRTMSFLTLLRQTGGEMNLHCPPCLSLPANPRGPPSVAVAPGPPHSTSGQWPRRSRINSDDDVQEQKDFPELRKITKRP